MYVDLCVYIRFEERLECLMGGGYIVDVPWIKIDDDDDGFEIENEIEEIWTGVWSRA